MLAARTPTARNAGSIAETAAGNPKFSTLVAALEKAGLVKPLAGSAEDGTFTVFAPTNEAFEAYLTKKNVTAEKFLERTDLSSILLHHVSQGTALSSDLIDGQKLPTVQGNELTVALSGGKVKVGNGEVTAADIACDNGVIHVVDHVLFPPRVLSVAEQAGAFTTLLAAVKAAHLSRALLGPGPFTVFAPDDSAFATFMLGMEITHDELLARPDLTKILKHHVVPGLFRGADLADRMSLTTLAGSSIRVFKTAQGVQVGGVMVKVADVPAGNGVIHVMGAVMVKTTVDPLPRPEVLRKEAHSGTRFSSVRSPVLFGEAMMRSTMTGTGHRYRWR